MSVAELIKDRINSLINEVHRDLSRYVSEWKDLYNPNTKSGEVMKDLEVYRIKMCDIVDEYKERGVSLDPNQIARLHDMLRAVEKSVYALKKDGSYETIEKCFTELKGVI